MSAVRKLIGKAIYPLLSKALKKDGFDDDLYPAKIDFDNQAYLDLLIRSSRGTRRSMRSPSTL
jgi:hypothetical protein